MTPLPPGGARGDRAFLTLAAIAGVALLLFLALPVIALLLRAAPARLLEHLRDPAVRDALGLSVITAASATALVVVLGAPLAWLLATREFPGKRIAEALVQLPMVLPPTVAGFALLMAFGRFGIAGAALAAFGVRLPFTTVGVIVAQAFMAAPFFVLAARAGFASLDRRLLDAAATLRASESFTFARIAVPLARPALVAGAAMSAARALGEFGATLTFAGNLPGVTRTLPLAVYTALQSDLDAAAVLAVLLLLISAALLIALRLAPQTLPWSRSGARD